MKDGGGLINFLPLKRRGEFIRGGLSRGFMLEGEWVKALGAMVSGIVWVASTTYDWLMVAINTIDQS